MTTEVVVRANHGWPVKVTKLTGFKSGPLVEGTPNIVKAGQEQSFHVWDGQDLLIHEIQPTEPEFAENSGR